MKALALYRCSTSMQEDSIAQQKSIVEKFCKDKFPLWLECNLYFGQARVNLYAVCVRKDGLCQDKIEFLLEFVQCKVLGMTKRRFLEVNHTSP